MNVEKLLDFLKECEDLKNVYRSLYVSEGDRHESTAEHSWHLALACMLFAEKFDADLEKMLKLAVMHDLVEVITGDVSAFDFEARKGKEERERKAAKELFGELPESFEKEFFRLFEEYEGKSSREAKLVNSLDKMLPIIQNICSGGKSWEVDEISYEDIESIKRGHMEHDDEVLEMYELLLREADRKDLFAD